MGLELVRGCAAREQMNVRRKIICRTFSVEDNIERRMKELRGETAVAESVRGTVQGTVEGVVRFGGVDDEHTKGLTLNTFVQFENGSRGIVVRLGKWTHALLLDDDVPEVGELVSEISSARRIPRASNFRGRVVDALGDPLDGKGDIACSEDSDDGVDLFGRTSVRAGWLLDTAPVVDPLRTGTKLIDGMFPIGRGHRVTLCGSRGTGKTSLALNILKNQNRTASENDDEDRHYIYLSFGQSRSSVARLVTSLRSDPNDIMRNTTIIAVTPEESSGRYVVALQTALAMASNARDSGSSAILVCDELSPYSALHEQTQQHAAMPVPAVRAAQILESASQLSAAAGAGSLSVFLLIDVDDRDSTNRALSASEARSASLLQSLTEGARSTSDVWLHADASLAQRGVYPPIDLRSAASGAPIPQYQSLALAHVGSAVRQMVAQHFESASTVELAATFGISSEEEGYAEFESMNFLDALHALLQQPFDALFEDDETETARTLTAMCIAAGGSLERLITTCGRQSLDDKETAAVVRTLEHRVWEVVVSDDSVARYARQLAEASAARPTTDTLDRTTDILVEPLQGIVDAVVDDFISVMDANAESSSRKRRAPTTRKPKPPPPRPDPAPFNPFGISF